MWRSLSSTLSFQEVTMPQSPPKQIFDWNKPAGNKTEIKGFRIFTYQRERLNQDYNGNTSALVRFLLDKYFDNKIPAAKIEFEALIKQSK